MLSGRGGLGGKGARWWVGVCGLQRTWGAVVGVWVIAGWVGLFVSDKAKMARLPDL